MKPIVKIENVSKSYRIGGLHPGYITLREMLGGVLLAPFKAGRRSGLSNRETIWALKNVNLEVHQGELIGIIGRNGAGKSTLLKILSRVTRPVRGRIAIYGRVGSLLEVGTGFHPDLTGRENVFLNGAILGMRRVEIKRKFDEIVAFSEIGKFIETPVKWYSNGMYVRLAFSIAAHLEPEVLIMDEVLAVGDAGFQQKCLDKMHEIRQQGRTIFFVSHNMSAVTRLCRRVILLENGSIVSDGAAQQVVNDYLSASWNIGAEQKWYDAAQAPGNDIVWLRHARVVNEAGQTVAAVDIKRRFGIEVTYEVIKSGYALSPVIDIFNEELVQLFSSHDTGETWRRRERPAGTYTSTAWIPGNLLAEGNLLANVSVVSRSPMTLHFEKRNVLAFQVIEREEGQAARGDYTGPIPGVMRPLLSWTTRSDALPEASE